MTKVLSSVKVLEIGGIGPGPFCAMHLADLGADVISVVRAPNGTPPITGPVLNRGKRSVFADLKTPEGKALVLSLCATADVLIEGMRPGVMERLGLGPDECRAQNPKLVYARMTGWGQSGPLAPAAGHDTNYVAVSGALWGASPTGAAPVTPFTLAGDIMGGGLYLAIGILSGVLKARETGQGTVVDAAIVDGSAHAMNLMLSARKRGIVGDERGQSMYDSSPFYETYLAGDGRYVTVGSLEPQFYQMLLDKLGLVNDPDFSTDQWDKAMWPKRHARMAALFGSQPSSHWQALLEGTDVCFGVVQSPMQAAEHPHMKARGVYLNHEGQFQTAPAPRFGDAAYAPGPICADGAHTQEVLGAVAAKGQVWR
jgi:alpha-methylacyl-CoA racemase